MDIQKKLAPELIHEILHFAAASTDIHGVNILSKPDLSNFRKVCRSFWFEATPLLFSEISFTYLRRSKRFDVTPKYLETLTEKTNPFYEYTKTLKIDYTDEDYLNTDILAERESFMFALRYLTKIRVFHWDMSIDQSTSTALDTLYTFEHLEEIHINCRDWIEMPSEDNRVIFPFPHFKNLQRIHIRGTHPYISKSVTEIQKMVANRGAVLSDLSLTYCFPYGYKESSLPPQSVLQEIYHNVETNTAPALRHLALVGPHLVGTFVPNLLPHLRNLSSLYLSTAIKRTLDEETRFWGDLEGAGVQLKILAIDNMTAPLLKYLKSFIGLEKLSVHSGGYTVPSVQSLSCELVTRILPQHKATLISYESLYETGQSLSASYVTWEGMQGLIQCTKLHTLAFAISTLDFPIFTEIIKMALCLPHITDLRLILKLMGPDIPNDSSIIDAVDAVCIPEDTMHNIVERDLRALICSYEFLPYMDNERVGRLGLQTCRSPVHYKTQ